MSLAERHAEREITGPAEIRTGGSGSFNTFRGPTMYVTHFADERNAARRTIIGRQRARALPRAAIPSALHHVVRALSTICADARMSIRSIGSSLKSVKRSA